MGKTVELLPKTPFINTFSQSAHDAIDTENYATAALEVTVEGLVAPDSVTINLESANRLDERAFADTGMIPITVVGFAGAPQPLAGFGSVTGIGKYLRVSLTPTLAAATGINVRAIVHLSNR